MIGPIETEIKIPMPRGAEEAARLVESQGYRVTAPRTLQVDQIYDFEDRTLRQSGKLLRVRSEDGPDGGAILTFKGPVTSAAPHKSREELETSAASLDTLERILQRLGFVRSFRYEKYRTTYRFVQEASGAPEAGTGPVRPPGNSGGSTSQAAPGSVVPASYSEAQGVIALDETPIGVFLELEGPPYWIDRTAESLGFMPNDYVTASYAALYRDHLASHGGPSDMTFLGRS